MLKTWLLGKKESRDWLTNVKGNYTSFFKYWNKAKKELKKSRLNE